MTESKKPSSDPTLARSRLKDVTASKEETVADHTVARQETLLANRAAPLSSQKAAAENDPDKTQLSQPQSADPDATVKTNPGPDNDKTVLTSQAEQSLSSPTGKTGATGTLVRKYQRTNTGDLAIGSVIRERFVIEKLLGSGGMGSVYRALATNRHL